MRDALFPGRFSVCGVTDGNFTLGTACVMLRRNPPAKNTKPEIRVLRMFGLHHALSSKKAASLCAGINSCRLEADVFPKRGNPTESNIRWDFPFCTAKFFSKYTDFDFLPR
ncbi:hypothetical protein [Yeguia hominis]|uniref:Uncharacterized protein n=1 Tax=Yeguia hominis TaxID=2763662 RepID=A0A926HT43_9FIRM|nr:hypothetical protein [Yeguia hominis]MBC8534081.1 hypothetical protein [Yeguia hominis]